MNFVIFLTSKITGFSFVMDGWRWLWRKISSNALSRKLWDELFTTVWIRFHCVEVGKLVVSLIELFLCDSPMLILDDINLEKLGKFCAVRCNTWMMKLKQVKPNIFQRTIFSMMHLALSHRASLGLKSLSFQHRLVLSITEETGERLIFRMKLTPLNVI